MAGVGDEGDKRVPPLPGHRDLGPGLQPFPTGRGITWLKPFASHRTKDALSWRVARKIGEVGVFEIGRHLPGEYHRVVQDHHGLFSAR